MRCSKCGAENPDRTRFCVECASQFARRCPSCGAENPPTAKFCLECATALSVSAQTSNNVKPDPGGIRVKDDNLAPAETEGERKTVTALFADIKGSMDLMEDIDPEEARAIVDPALKLMMNAVHHYDGYIVQSTGDGIFALFGAPVAHEHHPQRALYAALRMQEDLKRYSDRTRAEGCLPIQVRVGVNTGEVVVARSRPAKRTGSTRQSVIRPVSQHGCRRWRRSVRSRRPSRSGSYARATSPSRRSVQRKSKESPSRSMCTRSRGWVRCARGCSVRRVAVTRNSWVGSARWRRSSMQQS